MKPPTQRYVRFAEREEIAILRAQGHGVREIARRLERAASTISRELRRNAATRRGGLDYRATTAQWHAERSARRPNSPDGRRMYPRGSRLMISPRCASAWRPASMGLLRR